MIWHGYVITFRHRKGSLVTLSANGFSTFEEARENARKTVIELGYQTPRWWEFWRWHESAILRGSDLDGEEAQAAKDKEE